MKDQDVRQDDTEQEGRFGRGFTYAVKFVVPIWVVIVVLVVYFS